MQLLFGNKAGVFVHHERKLFSMTQLFLSFGKIKSVFLTATVYWSEQCVTYWWIYNNTKDKSNSGRTSPHGQLGAKIKRYIVKEEKKGEEIKKGNTKKKKER